MKLLCKNNSTFYTCGKYYEFRDEILPLTNLFNVFCVRNDLFSGGQWFTLVKGSTWYLWDHFFTEQEVRKLKLKQLETTL